MKSKDNINEKYRNNKKRNPGNNSFSSFSAPQSSLLADMDKGGLLTIFPEDIAGIREPLNHQLLVTPLNNRKILLSAGSALSRIYSEHHAVKMIVCGVLRGWMPLNRIHRIPINYYPVALYLAAARQRNTGELLQLMEILRSPRGCPWDREQTHHSLKPYLLEEACEVIAAIEEGDLSALQEELGDVLLQVIFHAQVAREAGSFKLDDVVKGIITKLIRRHPHVFGSTVVSSVNEVMENWEDIKRNEKRSGEPKRIAEEMDIHSSWPALLQAQKVQEKAAGAGFDWPDAKGALQKLVEECAELKSAYISGSGDKIAEEAGDVLFAMVNVLRLMSINPEIALRRTVDKFRGRFAYIEEQVLNTGKDFSSYSLEELDKWWDEAKMKERNGGMKPK